MIISYHIKSYHIISYHIISFHIISYHIISYHIISYHIILLLAFNQQTNKKATQWARENTRQHKGKVAELKSRIHLSVKRPTLRIRPVCREMKDAHTNGPRQLRNSLSQTGRKVSLSVGRCQFCQSCLLSEISNCFK